MAKDIFEAVGGDEEAFIPDGWDGVSDLFAEDGGLNDEAFIRDGGEDQVEEAPKNTNGKSDEEFLTTEFGQENGQDADAADEAQTDGSKTEKKAPRILKLKVNHEEQEVDIDSMSDDDLITLLQKGRAFDAVKDAEKKQLYRDTYQAQIDAGMTEDVAAYIAERKAGKAYDLVDPTPEEDPKVVEPEQPRMPRNFREEVAQLKELYPEFTEVPDEVAKAVAKGAPLLTAYLAYREKQTNRTAASLKKENQVLKQNAASAAKAPVRGVSGGGDSTPKRRDYFLEGFDSDY